MAPLAATLTRVDFVIAAYGLAVSPLDEDREAVALDMARHGFGADETRKALEVARAAEVIIKNGFTHGYSELEALRARWAASLGSAFLRGNVTGLLLADPEAFWRESGPVFFAGILPDYDPMPVLKKLRTPHCGLSAPTTSMHLQWKPGGACWCCELFGLPISAVIFPGAEHGMYEYELNTKGRARDQGATAAIFGLMRDFIVSGKIDRQYGDAVVVR